MSVDDCKVTIKDVMRHDEHYQLLSVQPKDVVRAWAKHWATHPEVIHPLGEAIYKMARFTLKGGRSDLEKAWHHLGDVLDMLEE